MTVHRQKHHLFTHSPSKSRAPVSEHVSLIKRRKGSPFYWEMVHLGGPHTLPHWEKVLPWRQDSNKLGVTAKLIKTKMVLLANHWDLNPSLLAIGHNSSESGNKLAVSPVLEGRPSSSSVSSGIGQRQWRGCGMQEHRLLMADGSPYS